MVGNEELLQLVHLLRISAETARLIAMHSSGLDTAHILEIAEKIEALSGDLVKETLTTDTGVVTLPDPKSPI